MVGNLKPYNIAILRAGYCLLVATLKNMNDCDANPLIPHDTTCKTKKLPLNDHIPQLNIPTGLEKDERNVALLQ